MWGRLLVMLLQWGPSILGDAENVFNEIAHGEGGRQKIANAAAAIGALAGHITQAAVSAGHIDMSPIAAALGPTVQAASPQTPPASIMGSYDVSDPTDSSASGQAGG